ncbi:hypothetical protein BX616_002478 [Lobosporangium transversale]|uniref:F-box domain-containing protein n=1 Tax=Lobosporangium transversale TaxID=64571 RepID=A0A1Y2GY73_9FUNG|nr:hypothetical protein BCR41DRAFT_346506 [Lobosporangium transversale]KAF9916903.1 hypothetical protein BX616_002478 [Lobosporangium transversale]ORZ27215.1 hypothetical protein BCR41DRAFT_346506 [Lobosporangium transversale]|eukprot:XP_021884942.1 hypothetical protein BCR41DRAFT_346506 [Lobosporangium transversale]
MNSSSHASTQLRARAMNPLTVPELRLAVGRYLATRDILVCILVCREWYHDFKSMLYHSIRLDEPTIRLLPQAVLRQHAHLIQHLILMEPMRLTLSTLESWVTPFNNSLISTIAATDSLPPPPPSGYCCNLLSLEILPSILFRKHVYEQVPRHRIWTVGTDQYDILKDDFWCLQSIDACIRLIQKNPNLHTLTENWDDMSSYHRIRFTDRLCQLDNRLVRLHLSKWEVTPDKLNMLIEHSPKLELIRFSKLVLKKSTGVGVGLHAAEVQSTAESQDISTASTTIMDTSTASILNLRQLKVFAISHGTFQLNDLLINAPELYALSISFSQANYSQSTVSSTYFPISPSSFTPSFGSYGHQQQHPYQHHSQLPPSYPPRVNWDAPKLRMLICNRTEANVATSTLLNTPQHLRTISFANYEIESKLVSQIVAAQGLQLESIRLACFSGITGRDIRLILTRCPNLVSLYAPEIMMYAGDLAPATIEKPTLSTSISSLPLSYSKSTTTGVGNIEDWACQKLERLSVYICLEPNMGDDGQYDDPYQFCIGHKEDTPCSSAQAFSSYDAADNFNIKEMDKGIAQQQKHPHHPQEPRHPLVYRQKAYRTSSTANKLSYQYCHCRQNYNVDVRNAFLDQLSKLTRLQYLDLSGEHVEQVDHVQIGLPWTLDGGMEGRLETLQNLEHIAVTGWVEDMEIREIAWMKRSWAKLRKISLLQANGTMDKGRFKALLAREWPELVVQDKNRMNIQHPPLLIYQ